MTPRELSDRLGTVEPAVLMVLRGMERLNLVRRERDPSYRRKMRVFLTERAITLEAELMQVGEQDNQLMLQALAKGADRQVKDGLRVIRGQLACGDDGVLRRHDDESADGAPVALEKTHVPHE